MDENETPQEPIEASTPTTLNESVPAPTRKAGKAGVLLVAIAVALTAGITVVALRSSAGSALDKKVPGDVLVFASGSVSPSTSQKLALKDLLDRLPAAQRTQITQGIDGLLNRLLDKAGMSYTVDVKPWLEQVALAVRAAPSGGSGGPVPVFLLKVKDEAAATKALAKLAASNAGNQPPAYFVNDGVAYLAQSMAIIDAFKKDAGGSSSLSENAEYQHEAEKVGGDSLFFLWVNGRQIGSVLKAAPIPPTVQTLFGDFPPKAVAVAVRAESDGIVFAGHSSGGPSGTKGGTPKLLEATSSGLLGAMSVFDLAAQFDRIAKVAGGAFLAQGMARIGTSSSLLGSSDSGAPAVTQVFPPTPADPKKQIVEGLKQATGLDLDTDILPWLHGEFSVVVGGFSNPPIPDMGVLIQPTDDAAATKTLDALRARAGAFKAETSDAENGFDITPTGGVDMKIAVRHVPGKVVIASSPEYASTLLHPAATATLADDTVYKRAMSGGDGATVFELFLRFDRIRSLVETFLPSDQRARYDAGPAQFLKIFESIGVHATTAGAESSVRVLLTVAK